MQTTSTFLDADVDYELCSIASSNETADNLPGPGRLLGKLYDSAGQRLENGLGRVAVRIVRASQATHGINQELSSPRLHPRSHSIKFVSYFSGLNAHFTQCINYTE